MNWFSTNIGLSVYFVTSIVLMVILTILDPKVPGGLYILGGLLFIGGVVVIVDRVRYERRNGRKELGED